MSIDADSLSRIAKLFIDRDDVSLDEAERNLAGFRILFRCGPELQQSPTLQAAVLTAANVAQRCFPGAVRIQGADDAPLLLPWTPGHTLASAVAEVAGQEIMSVPTTEAAAELAFGTVDDACDLQATFDGWTCAVSPFQERLRLREREACVLTGVALGALAISELFLGNFGFSIEAGSRSVGISLWRPDLPWHDSAAAAAERPVRHLPSAIWFLGLGHLGQAFVWAFSLLPFRAPKEVRTVLHDFDRLIHANLGTGLLSYERDLKQLKTRIASAFLEARGFQTNLIERRFDEYTHPQHGEPAIMLAGMDSRGPRHLLDSTGFTQVIDCGIGGTPSNFDSITLNVLPNPRKTAAELWPETDSEDRDRRQTAAAHLASHRGIYRAYAQDHSCGHVELAGRSVAVPFVGAIAASLALSELLRRFMGGAQFDYLRLSLASPQDIHTAASDKSGLCLRAPFQEIAMRA